MCNEESRAQPRPESVLQESVLLSYTLWGSMGKQFHMIVIHGGCLWSQQSFTQDGGLTLVCLGTRELHLEEGEASPILHTCQPDATPANTENEWSQINTLTFFQKIFSLPWLGIPKQRLHVN